MTFRFVAVAGLPRSGSTLLCQLLASHPQIYCEGHSSPLCNAVLQMRRGISDDGFFLSQLDAQFDTTYANLRGALRGFMQGWYAGNVSAQVVVDKNRAWLQAIELLLELEPEARVLVPIRELGQVYGSIEAQHQRTALIDFADHLADLDRFSRAEALFGRDKTLGAQLMAINAVRDLPEAVRSRIHYVRFEELVRAPREKMQAVFAWLGVAPHEVDPARLAVRPHESDSHYRYKFPHRQAASIQAPAEHAVPPRIQTSIERAWHWYYEQFYPWVGGGAD
jgi:sulfotransferase